MVNVCGQLRDILKLTVFFQLCSNSLKIFFSFNMTNSASVHKARSKKNGFPSLVWKNLTGLHRALTSTPPDINEPDLLTQRRCWTSLKLLRLNWSKIPAARLQSLVKSLKTRRVETVIAAVWSPWFCNELNLLVFCGVHFWPYHVSYYTLIESRLSPYPL